MPSYKVIARGFFNGVIYDPEGKRRVLHTDTPFDAKKTPTWLSLMKPENASEKAKRVKQEKRRASTELKKTKRDRSDIESASVEKASTETSFISTSGSVETI